MYFPKLCGISTCAAGLEGIRGPKLRRRSAGVARQSHVHGETHQGAEAHLFTWTLTAGKDYGRTHTLWRHRSIKGMPSPLPEAWHRYQSPSPPRRNRTAQGPSCKQLYGCSLSFRRWVERGRESQRLRVGSCAHGLTARGGANRFDLGRYRCQPTQHIPDFTCLHLRNTESSRARQHKCRST